MIAYVTGFMFSMDKKRVALIVKRHPAWQRGKLNGIGGKIEAGESPDEAMAREFCEEAGVSTQASDWQKFCILTCPGQSRVDFFFTFSDAVHDVRTMEQEEVLLCDVAHLPEHILPNLAWLIPMVLDARMCFDTAVEMLEKPLSSMLN